MTDHDALHLQQLHEYLNLHKASLLARINLLQEPLYLLLLPIRLLLVKHSLNVVVHL